MPPVICHDAGPINGKQVITIQQPVAFQGFHADQTLDHLLADGRGANPRDPSQNFFQGIAMAEGFVISTDDFVEMSQQRLIAQKELNLASGAQFQHKKQNADPKDMFQGINDKEGISAIRNSFEPATQRGGKSVESFYEKFRS